MGNSGAGPIKKELKELKKREELLQSLKDEISKNTSKRIEKDLKGKKEMNKKEKFKLKKLLLRKVRADFIIGEIENLSRRVESLIDQVEVNGKKKHSATIGVKLVNIRKCIEKSDNLLNEENSPDGVKEEWSEEIEKEYDRLESEVIKKSEGKLESKRRKKGVNDDESDEIEGEEIINITDEENEHILENVLVSSESDEIEIEDLKKKKKKEEESSDDEEEEEDVKKSSESSEEESEDDDDDSDD